MKIIFKIFFVLLVGILPNSSSAQDKKEIVSPKLPKLKVHKKPIPRRPLKEKPYNRSIDFGFKLASNGYGINIHKWKLNEDAEQETWNTYYFQINTIHHAREVSVQSKLPNPSIDKGPQRLSYVYGKVNYLLPMQIGLGQRKKISNKLERNHIQINAVYKAGINLAWVAPYYLKIANQNAGGIYISVDEKYSELNATKFLDPRFVYGSSGLSKGLNNVNLVPGLHANMALQFEYKTNKKSNLILELGMDHELNMVAIEILAKSKTQFYFPSVYACLKKGIIWQSKTGE